MTLYWNDKFLSHQINRIASIKIYSWRENEAYVSLTEKNTVSELYRHLLFINPINFDNPKIDEVIMEDFSTKTELRIDWSEIDLFGHVNNLAIMKYAQAARVKLLESIGLMQLQYEAKKGPILASISCQFRKALFYPGKVTVYSKVSAIKNTSFEIQHIIYDEHKEIAAQAKDIIVFFDFTGNTKLKIPDDIRENLGKM